MPPFRAMPNMQKILLKANNISELNLDFSSDNYANMINIDIRNNKKLMVSLEELEMLGIKLSKFKKLRFFNIEHINLDLKSDYYRSTYHNLIKRLPYSMEMFNNSRTMYLNDEVNQ